MGDHLCRVFNGSFEPPDIEDSETPDLSQRRLNTEQRDHGYASPSGLKLPKNDCSGSLVDDPEGWSNRPFKFDEVKTVLSGLSSGKSPGWDTIPNEFLKNSPDVLVKWLVVLFNKIKTEKRTPKGWNKGRVTLIHKSGPREILSNYRPVTVIISLCGLFSKVLNQRLSELVEYHGLLGEV